MAGREADTVLLIVVNRIFEGGYTKFKSKDENPHHVTIESTLDSVESSSVPSLHIIVGSMLAVDWLFLSVMPFLEGIIVGFAWRITRFSWASRADAVLLPMREGSAEDEEILKSSIVEFMVGFFPLRFGAESRRDCDGSRIQKLSYCIALGNGHEIWSVSIQRPGIPPWFCSISREGCTVFVNVKMLEIWLSFRRLAEEPDVGLLEFRPHYLNRFD